MATNEKLCDFCDGSYFSTHTLFGSTPNALQILFYYDDIEMCNPLGSHVKKHKLDKNDNYHLSDISCY